MTYLAYEGHEGSYPCGSGWVLFEIIHLESNNNPPATAGGTDFMLREEAGFHRAEASV
jgi:hypothetical protein